MPVVLKRSPFKGKGIDKERYSVINGVVYKLHHKEIKRCIKESGEDWTIEDCDNVIQRLLHRGLTLACVQQLSGYSKTYFKNVSNGSQQMNNKFKAVMLEIEEGLL